MHLRPRVPIHAGLLRARPVAVAASPWKLTSVSPQSRNLTRASIRPCAHPISRPPTNATTRHYHVPGFAREVTVRSETLSVTIHGESEPLGLSFLWLRDVCTCARCVDPHSGQKNFSTTDLDSTPQVQSAETTADGALKVTWVPDALSDGAAPHESIYTPAQLERWRTDHGERIAHKLPDERIFWDRSTYTSLLNSEETKISYKDWTTDRDAFWRAFAALSRTGLIFVTDVPHGEKEVETIANQIGILQHTFYGFTWDVRSKPQAENVAYTSVFLGLHQDLMYHVPIPRLQFLHCLENSCEGGESLFSDGVRAAYELRHTHPEHNRILTQHPVHFYYDREPHFYEMARPTIYAPTARPIEATHWAPPFQAPFPRDYVHKKGTLDTGHMLLARWKKAAKAFERNISDPRNMFQVKLKPGECVIFDNWRVLHGRREFAAASGGSRWLKGTYVTDQVFRAMQDKRPRGAGEEARPDRKDFRRALAEREDYQVRTQIKR